MARLLFVTLALSIIASGTRHFSAQNKKGGEVTLSATSTEAQLDGQMIGKCHFR
jgi:hypothetical protein